MKKIILSLCCFVAFMLIAVAGCYKIVGWTTESSIYGAVRELPYNKVGLLLGTSPVGRNGKENLYFKYRIEAAVQLYKAGKISYILLSGDNHTKEYDEPKYMKKALLSKGVPEEAIVLDYAGFRTLDSVVRAKEVFGQNSFTIISQKFHNERAVYLAHHYGISAVGYNAREVKRLNIPVLRESLARVKMFLDILFHKKPKFLGEKIEIG